MAQMECGSFGKCGSCVLHELPYAQQLARKHAELKELLVPYFGGEVISFASKEEYFRQRAEFRIYKDATGVSYAMSGFDKRPVVIDECLIVTENIHALMPRLREWLNIEREFARGLFAVEFMEGEERVLSTLIFHRRLEESDIHKARMLEGLLGIDIILRSRKQKEVLSRDYIELVINEKRFICHENSFLQPNRGVNEKMIEWALKAEGEGDYLELYCGFGNFTLFMSERYNRLFATEVSKVAIRALEHNISINKAENINYARLSDAEIKAALAKEREFVRLRGKEIESYDFRTLFVDPPRAGMGESVSFAKDFDTIIYISCNPHSFIRDMETLTQTHRIVDAALFDQFPYTKHMEMGAVIKKEKR